MKTLTVVALVLIILGILSLVFDGIPYSKNENRFDLGPIHARTEERKSLPIPQGLGVAALLGGAVLLLVSLKKAK